MALGEHCSLDSRASIADSLHDVLGNKGPTALILFEILNKTDGQIVQRLGEGLLVAPLCFRYQQLGWHSSALLWDLERRRLAASL